MILLVMPLTQGGGDSICSCNVRQFIVNVCEFSIFSLPSIDLKGGDNGLKEKILVDLKPGCGNTIKLSHCFHVTMSDFKYYKKYAGHFL